MRRSSYDCESDCAPLLSYLPCLPESKEVAGSRPVPGSPSPAAAVAEEKPPMVKKIEAAEEKPPVVQKIEEAAAASPPPGCDDEEGCKVVPVAPKSSMKRADCANSKGAVKGNVKWMDLLGKDLTQVKEFEPSESGDYDDEDAGPCTCVIL